MELDFEIKGLFHVSGLVHRVERDDLRKLHAADVTAAVLTPDPA
jgi:hypothetical protein